MLLMLLIHINLWKLPSKLLNQSSISDFNHPNHPQVTEPHFLEEKAEFNLLFLSLSVALKVNIGI